MWDGRRPGDYVPLTAWEYICFIECERYTKFFQFERNAFHRYMQSLGYDVSLEKVMDGLKRMFIIWLCMEGRRNLDYDAVRS